MFISAVACETAADAESYGLRNFKTTCAVPRQLTTNEQDCECREHQSVAQKTHCGDAVLEREATERRKCEEEIANLPEKRKPSVAASRRRVS